MRVRFPLAALKMSERKIDINAPKTNEVCENCGAAVSLICRVAELELEKKKMPTLGDVYYADPPINTGTIPADGSCPNGYYRI